MRVNTDDALKSNGMEVFVGLLSHNLPVIRSKAARDIMDLRYRYMFVLVALKLLFLEINVLDVFYLCSNTGSIRDDPYWTSRKNSLELIKIPSINKVSLV